MSKIVEALKRISKLNDVKIVFTTKSKNKIFVYIVVNEFSIDLYNQLMPIEKNIIEKFSNIKFSFRVRASQGKDPSSIVPNNACSI